MARRRRRSLTRADWLSAALRALERGGLDAVRVLPLSAAVGATRGSFYWHFRDRAELLAMMLEYWELEFTDAVLVHVRATPGGPRERFRALLEDVLLGRRGRYDPAIRAWALHDGAVARIVRRVDRRRLAFMKSLFYEMGFGSAEAAARARLTLAYLEGDHLIFVAEPPAARRRFLRLRHRLLTAR